jgi:hypothetical protein
LTSTHTSHGQAQQTTSFSPSCYPTPTLASHPHTHGTHRNVTTSSRSAHLIASNNAQSGPSAVSNSHSHTAVPPTAGPSSSHAYSSSASSTSGSSTSSSSGSGGFGASSGHGQAGSGGSAAGSGSGASGGGAGGSAGKKPPSRHMIWYREVRSLDPLAFIHPPTPCVCNARPGGSVSILPTTRQKVLMTLFLFPPCQIVPAMLPVIAIGTGVFFVSLLSSPSDGGVLASVPLSTR